MARLLFGVLDRRQRRRTAARSVDRIDEVEVVDVLGEGVDNVG